MNSTRRNLEEKTAAALVRLLPPQTASIAVSYSGGPDSTALLHVLCSLRDIGALPFPELSLAAVYVNHNLRSSAELERERATLQQTAESLAVPLTLLTSALGEIPTLAAVQNQGLEAAARTVRYRMIQAWMEENGIEVLLTAHTRDDQEETLIMRFFSGAGPEGLLGIPEVNGTVVRPFLNVRKSEILEYLSTLTLSCSMDSTNADPAYLRNSVRMLIVHIKEVFPGYQKGLQRFQEKLQSAAAHIRRCEEAERRPALLLEFPKEDTVTFPKDVFLSLDSYERLQLLNSAWNHLCDSRKSLPYSTVRFLLDRRGSGFQEPGKRLLEYDGTSMYSDGNRIIWVNHVVHSRKNSYLKVVNSSALVLVIGYELLVRSIGSEPAGRDEAILQSSQIQYPLVVRSFLPGDEIRLAEGRKKVVKLFSDWKIFADMRWKVPVAADRSGLVAVMGRAFGGSDRVAVRHKDDAETMRAASRLALRVVRTGSIRGNEQ
jgi:tRNA(Ile)-lysidine synthase